jgi:hypothetical protein
MKIIEIDESNFWVRYINKCPITKDHWRYTDTCKLKWAIIKSTFVYSFLLTIFISFMVGMGQKLGWLFSGILNGFVYPTFEANIYGFVGAVVASILILTFVVGIASSFIWGALHIVAFVPKKYTIIKRIEESGFSEVRKSWKEKYCSRISYVKKEQTLTDES